MSSKSSQSVNLPGFGRRLRDAFNGATNAVIANNLRVTEPAIGNYMKDRATLPIVIKTSELTGCSFNWLLTGEGEKYIKNGRQINFDELLETKIRAIVREELAKPLESPKTLTLPLDIGNKKEKKENKAA